MDSDGLTCIRRAQTTAEESMMMRDTADRIHVVYPNHGTTVPKRKVQVTKASDANCWAAMTTKTTHNAHQNLDVPSNVKGSISHARRDQER